MSLTGTGRPSRPERDKICPLDDAAADFPGSGRSILFYQDRARLPTVDRGEGIYLFDTEGNRYLDGCSGAMSANLGHGNARVLEAAVEQLGKVAFTYRTQFENEPANELAELLAKLSPPELSRVFFVNSGSEAVEASIKLARQYWWSRGQRGKSMIMATSPSYHGATLGALATTGYAPLNQPFRSMTMHSPKCSAAFCYHCPLRKTYPECGVDCARELARAIDVFGKDNIAAFMVEAIGGASTGGAVPPDEYLPMVEEICHDNDVLFIVDDVMMGCGRTGTFFGFEHWDVTPDIVTTSKGLSGGYTPIGAILATEHIVGPVLDSGGFMHGHTYAGNPLSAAIALAAVRELLDNRLVENARELGTYMHERLHELKGRYPMIGDIRGRGLLAGVEFVRNLETRESFPASWLVALETTELARSHGLLIYPRRSIHGLRGDHVLLAPPLIIDRAGVDEMIERFEATLDDLQSLLLSWIQEVPEDFEDQTIRRYQQLEDLPAYTRGDVSSAQQVDDANITAAMETGHYDPEDLEEHDDADEE